jgi:hypothetical protein
LPTFQWYFFVTLILDPGELNFWRYCTVVGILYPHTESLLEWSAISMWSWCLIFQSDECCVCMLCLYTQLSFVPAQMVWGMVGSQVVMPCPYAAWIRINLIGHPDSCCLLLIFSSLAANQLYHLGSRLGQDITDHLNPPTVTYTVWAGTDNGFVYKYSVQTQHPPHWPLMIETETVSELSGTNSTLDGWLVKTISSYTVAKKD